MLRYVRKDWPQTEALVRRLADKRGILVEYSSDIDRGSSVSFLDWRKHSLPHKRMGFLEIRVLDPYYWSIGKITRGTARDVDDLEAVIARQKLGWKKLLRLWARALNKSPMSTALSNVRRQMEAFLLNPKKGIFGQGYDGAAALLRFHRLLGLDAGKSVGAAKRRK